MSYDQTQTIKKLLQTVPDLVLAVLVGSQATGTAGVYSDWDMQFVGKNLVGLKTLENAENLRYQIAKTIDMTSARLAMCAVIAEEGKVLKGKDTLAWSNCLTLTWVRVGRLFMAT